MESLDNMSIASWVLIVTGLGWLGLDIWLYVAGRKTISSRIKELNMKLPVEFIFGVLMGHWFW